MKASYAIIAATAALAATGCMPDYNPSNYIEKYRVIGVKAEPPAVVFTPDYQGVVSLTLLDALPFRDATQTSLVDPVIESIEWKVCPISAGASARYACVLDEIPLSDVSTDGRTASFDGALVAFGLEMLGPQFDAIVDGLRQAVKFADQCTKDMLADYDGCLATQTVQQCNPPAFEAFKACLYQTGLTPVFHVTVKVTDMELDYSDRPVLDDDGRPVMRERVLETYKSVSFGPYGDDLPANRNPQFHIERSMEDDPIFAEILQPGAIVASTYEQIEPVLIQACPGQTLGFEAIVPVDSIDRLTADDGTVADEYFQLTWYTNRGRFAKIRTGSVAAQGKEMDLTNTLEFSAYESVGEASITIVMRDEAYGLNLVQFKVNEAPPEYCEELWRNFATAGGVK